MEADLFAVVTNAAVLSAGRVDELGTVDRLVRDTLVVHMLNLKHHSIWDHRVLKEMRQVQLVSFLRARGDPIQTTI